MKNSRGISVVSVVVTIIVIIIIASITIFTGSNMLRQAKEDRAYDRLDIIYQAIHANEDLLGISATPSTTPRTLSEDDYNKIGLGYLIKDNNFPDEITYQKRTGSISDISDTTKRTIILNDGTYEKSYEYSLTNVSYSTDIDFDAIAGVNRPQLNSKMTPYNFSSSSSGVEVKDIYEERWYSYDSLSPNYANMKIGSKFYVWIPRYAYKIQDYYLGNTMETVPASAIDVIFLKGTSNLDANGNKIPSDYKVHPAFTYGDQELTGIWIEKDSNTTTSNISGTYSSASYAISSANLGEKASIHMLKNTEWGAFAYLAQTCNAARSTVSSTGNYSGIKDINDSNKIEYVAAYITNTSVLNSNGSTLKNASAEEKDVYTSNGSSGNVVSVNSYMYGDAFAETSTGLSDTSAWFNSKSVQPDSTKPFIVRDTGGSVFGYTSSSGAESSACYRTVIIVEGTTPQNTIIYGTDAEYIKTTGDTYLYEPSLTGFNEDVTYYVTWNASGVETKTSIKNSAPSDWYNYTEKKWANILVENNGNKAYFVWIPRYVYKIASTTSSYETTEVRFVDINNIYKDASGNEEYIVFGSGATDWRIPEAFNWNGTPIQGYWISKYQVSKVEGFYVERFSDAITVISIDNKEALLGTGTYDYYLGNTKVGSASYDQSYKYTNLNPGTMYRIRVKGSNGTEMERNIQTIGSIPTIPDTTASAYFEAPVLTGFDLNKTFYVTWNSRGEETLTPATGTAPSNWYNYTDKRWANIVVLNGNNKAYFVWIPRYKYQLKYTDENDSDFVTGDYGFGVSNVKFIKATEGTAGTKYDDGYIIPKAFGWWNGTSQVELPGYWLSKYQVSASE